MRTECTDVLVVKIFKVFKYMITNNSISESTITRLHNLVRLY
jgi:hypothetical protein